MEWFTAPGYGLSRLVLQRTLAGVYLVAFLTAALQFRALIGSRGLMPVPRLTARVAFRHAPGVFRLHYSDRFFALCAWAGCAVSAALLAGADSLVPLWAGMLLWLLPWALYLSIVNVGQTWYAFGWESLLLEVGFLAVLLGNPGTWTSPPEPPTDSTTERGAGRRRASGDRPSPPARACGRDGPTPPWWTRDPRCPRHTTPVATGLNRRPVRHALAVLSMSVVNAGRA